MNAHSFVVAAEPAAQLENLLHLVAAIRDELAAAGIGPFSDIPELARAYSLARIAADLASRPEFRLLVSSPR
jgi:hypothetical protein